MKSSFKLIKYRVLVMVLLSIIFISGGRCQDEDEDDEEDTYDEELGDSESTTTRRSRPRRPTTTRAPSTGGRNNTQASGSSTVRTGAQATTSSSVPVPTPASAPAPPRTRATVRTTTLSEYEDDEVTTEEEGYGYVFRPLNNLIDNIVAGNVTGIVDNALSIRTPPEIRQFVNNVMANVFGAGIGNALKQFMPNLFSTQAPPTTVRIGRDPIPTQSSVSSVIQGVIQEPIPQQVQTQAVVVTRNASDEVKSAKTQTQQPIQLAFAHPGAPASRLRCEVIM